MWENCFENVRKKSPLIHCITNYVTVNDVANILLASGGSPIMSDEQEEVEEITALCNGLCINIGTLNSRTVPAMILAGKKANALEHPVLLDPVGAGASSLRTKTALQLIEEIKFDVIRGNISEIKTLAFGNSKTMGVDANVEDMVTEENLEQSIQFVKELAQNLQCIIAVTGAIDLVAGGDTCFIIRNGRPEMSAITGTGCQLSALMTAFLAANPKEKTKAAAAAVSMMGLAGEMAFQLMNPTDGNATYRNRIIDAVYQMTAIQLEEGTKYEVR